ncbi:hypothetical protein niasHT_010564 [Heterodera trifolii]|uniref:Uncharacterized protein n=1 Tax=Heterodera trifolii TaxID=157864 RepID=A0ABD2L3E0_9BILA
MLSLRRIPTKTLRVQFEIVRKKTNESHVMKYGDLTIQSENVAEFMGKKQAQKRNEHHHPAVNASSQHKFLTLPSRAASLLMMHKKRQNESQQDRHNIQHEERSVVEQQIKQIVHKLVQNANDSQRILTKHPKRIGNLDCHDEGYFVYCLKPIERFWEASEGVGRVWR